VRPATSGPAIRWPVVRGPANGAAVLRMLPVVISLLAVRAVVASAGGHPGRAFDGMARQGIAATAGCPS